MTRNNKGFSLIELVIAIAILAVAGVAIFGFVVNTSNSYSRTNKEVKLQYEQQLAVNQIRDMIVESDKGIYFDAASKSLALYGAVKKDNEGTKSYPVTVIRFVQPEGKMYFGTKDFSAGSEITFADVSTSKILSENVTEFNVDLTNVKKDKVLFQVTFTVGDREQTVKETVALRNRLVVSNMVDTIWGEEAGSVDSFIKGITICRGTTKFSTGDQDNIGLCGNEAVVVSYSAVVTAKAESTREYAVSWSLEDAPAGVAISPTGDLDVNVTVADSVEPSTQFKLKAMSVDDATKSTYITITVTNSGVYPKEAKLELGGYVDGNGYRTYTLIPTLIYTMGEPKQDYSLFTWMGLDSLPSGCSFDAATGTLILSSNANGYTFNIVAKAKERNSKGEVVLSNTLELKAEGIPEYNSGPSVSIAVASTLPRGGYIFPTMVFKNATSSTYTYDWWIEPYYDNDSTKWDTGEVANSSFNLVSLSETGTSKYADLTVKHEMQTAVNKRSIALNCAEWLNWSKTFKVVIYGTATDKNNNVLKAEPKIVTINPVEVVIEKTDASTIDPANWGWNENKPILTDSVIRYEDWYWAGKTKGTQAAKEAGARRWFTISTNNLYLNATNAWMMNCSLTYNYLFKNQVGTLLSNDTVGKPQDQPAGDKMMHGFAFFSLLYKWENLADRPVHMNYSITIKDNYGNAKNSNVESFTIEYEFYDPTEE